jgi:hypothetical protein
MMRGFRGLHGFPAHTIHAGISFVTTEQAPITVPSPMDTPGPMNALLATHAPSPILMGFENKGNDLSV